MLSYTQSHSTTALAQHTHTHTRTSTKKALQELAHNTLETHTPGATTKAKRERDGLAWRRRVRSLVAAETQRARALAREYRVARSHDQKRTPPLIHCHRSKDIYAIRVPHPRYMQQQQQQQAMANDKDSDDGWLAALEDDYVQSIGAEPDYEHQYAMERDASMRAMWTGFQESATSIAQLYRDRLSTNETGALWLPFQTAAGTVTTLYKESSDGLRRTGEAAIRSGYQRRTRELADWARKKNRRYIRREELLAYLAGKPPPPLHGGTKPERTASAGSHHHPHHHPGQSPLGHHHLHHHHSSYGGAHNNTSHTAHLHGSHHHQHHQHHHLHHSSHHAANTNGATGGGVGSHTLLSSSSSSSPAAVAYLAKAGIGCVGGDVDGLQQQQQQQSLQHQEGADGEQLHTFKEALARRPRAPDLYAFVTDEIARHSKRPASPLDINMDAQQNIGGKRTRFL